MMWKTDRNKTDEKQKCISDNAYEQEGTVRKWKIESLKKSLKE